MLAPTTRLAAPRAAHGAAHLHRTVRLPHLQRTVLPKQPGQSNQRLNHECARARELCLVEVHNPLEVLRMVRGANVAIALCAVHSYAVPTS